MNIFGDDLQISEWTVQKIEDNSTYDIVKIGGVKFKKDKTTGELSDYTHPDNNPFSWSTGVSALNPPPDINETMEGVFEGRIPSTVRHNPGLWEMIRKAFIEEHKE